MEVGKCPLREQFDPRKCEFPDRVQVCTTVGAASNCGLRPKGSILLREIQTYRPRVTAIHGLTIKLTGARPPALGRKKTRTPASG